jgi:hypothetical protein
VPQTVTVRTGGAGIDTRDFKDVVKVLRKAQPEAHKQLRRRLRKAGEIVAVAARELASEHSEKIPPTVKVRTAGATVAVIAGGKDAAIAPLFELGNTGGSKSAAAARRDKFRHPVYGNRQVWVDQDMHPFIAPAAAAHMLAVERDVVGALDDAARLITFGERHA